MFYNKQIGVYAANIPLPGDDLATDEQMAAHELAMQPKAIDQIRAIEARPEVADALTRLSRQNAIADKLAQASVSMPEDKAHEQLMAEDKAYAVLVNTEAEIDALRKQA